MTDSAESRRLQEVRKGVPWRRWGPYLSERQWGTVREDYSDGGDAWNYFTHDQARLRAFRWGEDGLAGVSDDRGFHGDNGAGIGASHQTGWTGVVAGLIQTFAGTDAQTFLRGAGTNDRHQPGP